MNKNLLIGIMKLHGDNQADLAKYIGTSLSRLNAKINRSNGAQFSQIEIAKIKAKYQLTPEEIDSIFFNFKLS